MKNRQQLLTKLRQAISEAETAIATSNELMCYIGPIDIEGLRVRLAELRKWERLLGWKEVNDKANRECWEIFKTF